MVRAGGRPILQGSANIRVDIQKTLARFFGIDFRALAVFRIGLGLLLLCDLLNRARHLKMFYSDSGVIPRTLLIDEFDRPLHFSLHLMNGTVGFQALLFLIAGAFAVALLVGYRTFWATLFSWIFLVSLHSRTPCVLQGGDVILRLYLFWSVFLPLGMRFSWDSRGKASGAHQNPVFLSMGTLAILLQICFVYWFTAAFKTHPQWRLDGDAVYYTLSIDQFSTPLGIALLSHPALMKTLSFTTLYLEQFGTYLAFVPFGTPGFRMLTILLFLGMHLGFLLCMELGLFPYISMLGWVLFLPREFFDFWERRRKSPPSVIPACRSETETATEGSPKDEGFARSSAGIQGTQRGLDSGFRRNNRVRQTGIQCLALFFLVYIYLWNVRTLDFKRYEKYFPKSWNGIGYFFRLEQKWSMFAARPMDDDGWFVIPAKLRDGTLVDLFRNGAPVRFEKPALVSKEYSNQRMRKFYMNLTDIEFKPYRRTLAHTLCREWNATHPKNKKIKRLTIYYMRETTMPYGQPPKLHKIKLWTHWHGR